MEHVCSLWGCALWPCLVCGSFALAGPPGLEVKTTGDSFLDSTGFYMFKLF